MLNIADRAINPQASVVQWNVTNDSETFDVVAILPGTDFMNYFFRYSTHLRFKDIRQMLSISGA